MDSLKVVLNAIDHFCKTLKTVNALEEFTFVFKPVDILSDHVNLTMQKALQELVDSLTSQVKANPICHDGGDVSQQGGQSKEAAVPNMEEAANKAKSSSAIPVPDEKLVQIRVDRKELNRRISSFLSRKRKEVDDSNAKEFCRNHLLDCDSLPADEINSCARVDAVFIPRSGCKSHVKVSRVDNRWGPQTVQPSSSTVTIKQESVDDFSGPTLQDIEERLRNMESHLRIKSEGAYRKSLYTKIKELEDRILFLEGLSPDYFHPRGLIFHSPQKKSRNEKAKLLLNCGIDELQRRMQELKEELKYKSSARAQNLFR